jgi:glycosyltransferase involved in cell wall biosynthesis
VPVVAQNEWGWREMIGHGESGFLANNDFELAHFAALLAYDEDLRQSIITQAHQRLREELANPERIWAEWRKLLFSVCLENSNNSSWPSLAILDEDVVQPPVSSLQTLAYE